MDAVVFQSWEVTWVVRESTSCCIIRNSRRLLGVCLHCYFTVYGIQTFVCGDPSSPLRSHFLTVFNIIVCLSQLFVVVTRAAHFMFFIYVNSLSLLLLLWLWQMQFLCISAYLITIPILAVAEACRVISGVCVFWYVGLCVCVCVPALKEKWLKQLTSKLSWNKWPLNECSRLVDRHIQVSLPVRAFFCICRAFCLLYFYNLLFLRATAYMLERVYATAIPYDCLSIHLSVTWVDQSQTVEARITQFSP